MSVTRYLGGRSKGVEIEIGEVKRGETVGVVMLVVLILFTIYLVLRGR